MQNLKYVITLILTSVIMIASAQQNIDIYHSYKSGNIPQWEGIIQTLEAKENMTNADKLELINYQYGYISYCISHKQKETAEQYMASVNKYIKQLEQQKYKLAVLYAYKAALVGFKIGISPYKAPFLSSESSEYAKKSVVLDTNNVLGYIQLGNIAYHKPGIFGGSKQEALTQYLRALELMEQAPEQLINNWNYLHLLLSIIKTYDAQENRALAQQYCEKALQVEPNFKEVKELVYPKILQQIAEE